MKLPKLSEGILHRQPLLNFNPITRSREVIPSFGGPLPPPSPPGVPPGFPNPNCRPCIDFITGRQFPGCC